MNENSAIILYIIDNVYCIDYKIYFYSISSKDVIYLIILIFSTNPTKHNIWRNAINWITD